MHNTWRGAVSRPIPWLTFATFFALILTAISVRAELRPDRVHVADSKKNQSYIHDGLITGGDKAIDEVVVKDIRRATNTGYERIVIDLEGTKNGEPAAIQRPPFYQVSVTPDEKRIVFTIWGKPRLSFDSRHVVNAFKKSAVIENVELLPRIEENTWSFVFQLRGDNPVEVFELSNPVRIIVDIKRDFKGGGMKAAAAESESKPARKAKARKAQKAPKTEDSPAIENAGGNAPDATGAPDASGTSGTSGKSPEKMPEKVEDEDKG